jgi:excisionase family DNA binding protein
VSVKDSQSSGSSRERRRHPEMFDIPGAAERLGTTPRHIRRLIQERRIPHYKVGSKIVLSADDCDAFLKQARREALR